MKKAELTRDQIVLAGMVAAGPKAKFDAVQFQKLFFLIDREIPRLVGGPHFDYQPHHYGPFDQAVFDVLDDLLEADDATINTALSYPLYSTTDSGASKGARHLEAMTKPASRYIREAAAWIVSTPFRRLLAAIYHRYPDMAQNNIMPDVTTPLTPPLRSPAQSFLFGMARTFDFFGTLDDCRPAIDGAEHDARAIYSDWCAVGDDLHAAMLAERRLL